MNLTYAILRLALKEGQNIYTTDHLADFLDLQINQVKAAFVGFRLIRREFAIYNARRP